MKRGAPLKRTGRLKPSKPIKRRTRLRAKGKGKYARRVRDVVYMRIVKTLPCSVHLYGFGGGLGAGAYPTHCQGEIQADHAGERPFGQKCPDNETIPMCSKHHRERTNCRGAFLGWVAAEMRVWCDYMIEKARPKVYERREKIDELVALLPIAIAMEKRKKGPWYG